MYIADVYWLALSDLRAGKTADAQNVLAQHYRPDMYVGHHTAYEKAMRVAAGFAEADEMLRELEAEPDDLQYAMAGYGICVWLELRGEAEKAAALRKNFSRATASGSASASLRHTMTLPDDDLTTTARNSEKADFLRVFKAFVKVL